MSLRIIVKQVDFRKYTDYVLLKSRVDEIREFSFEYFLVSDVTELQQTGHSGFVLG